MSDLVSATSKTTNNTYIVIDYTCQLLETIRMTRVITRPPHKLYVFEVSLTETVDLLNIQHCESLTSEEFSHK